MALSKRDRIGLIVLVAFFGFFAIVLVFTAKRPSGPVRGLENNIIVEQRLKHLREQQRSF